MTSIRRFWAATVVAVGFLFCTLAPAGAFVFGDLAKAHCFTGIVKSDRHEHDAAVFHDHGDQTATHDHSSDDDQSSSSNCCGIACVNAISTAVPDVAYVAVSIGGPRVLTHDAVIGSSPPLLYRPPIRL